MKVINLIKSIANDTLKKDVNGVREWDRMKLTMFSAWVTVLFMALRDFYFTGLRMDVWLTLVGVAMGSKLIDAGAKKLEK
jgi:hypothetical protein